MKKTLDHITYLYNKYGWVCCVCVFVCYVLDHPYFLISSTFIRKCSQTIAGIGMMSRSAKIENMKNLFLLSYKGVQLIIINHIHMYFVITNVNYFVFPSLSINRPAA